MKIISSPSYTYNQNAYIFPIPTGYQHPAITNPSTYSISPAYYSGIYITFGLCNQRTTINDKSRTTKSHSHDLPNDFIHPIFFSAIMGTLLFMRYLDPQNQALDTMFQLGLLYAALVVVLKGIEIYEEPHNAARQLINTIEECHRNRVVDERVIQRISNHLVHPTAGEVVLLCEGLTSLFQKNKPEDNPCRPLRTALLLSWFSATESILSIHNNYGDRDTIQEYLVCTYAFLSPDEKRIFDKSVEQLCRSRVPHIKALGCDIYFKTHGGQIDIEGDDEGLELTEASQRNYLTFRKLSPAFPDVMGKLRTSENLADTIALIKYGCVDLMKTISENDQIEFLNLIFKKLQQLAEQGLARSTFSKIKNPLQEYLKLRIPRKHKEIARDFFDRISLHRDPRVRSHFADMYLAIYS